MGKKKCIQSFGEEASRDKGLEDLKIDGTKIRKFILME